MIAKKNSWSCIRIAQLKNYELIFNNFPFFINCIQGKEKKEIFHYD